MQLTTSNMISLKVIYFEKTKNFCEISTIDLSYVVTVKSTVEISQNFVASSEYMNFILRLERHLFILCARFNTPEKLE